jgi:tRNA-uridine 2-sulfurtransferase
MSHVILKSSGLIKEALEKVALNNVMPAPGSKVAIAMSGGVDSSVAAALLARMNYEVFGITGWLMEGSGKCCDGGMLDSARICEIIGIDHQAQDLRDFFKSTIISPFLSSYAGGRTPVPCMPCNTEVKWGSLLEYSKSLGASHLASGHYARLLKPKDQNYSIGRSSDENKDQSYMLWGLNQEQLSRTAFPLANFTKEQIRALAHELNLTNWDKEESQDICFVPNKTRNFLLEHLGEKPGPIMDLKTGKILGQHSGTHLYTIGQRKGIGVSSQEPIYVVKLDSQQNVVYVGSKDDLASRGLIAEYANWQVPAATAFQGWVKIRYNSEALFAQVTPLEGGRFKVDFPKEEIGSITPGQAAVIYDVHNQYIIGGGWISRSLEG